MEGENPGKKRARQFDFDEIFQEARKTARERSKLPELNPTSPHPLSSTENTDSQPSPIQFQPDAISNSTSLAMEANAIAIPSPNIPEQVPQPSSPTPIQDPSSPALTPTIDTEIKDEDNLIGPPIPSDFQTPPNMAPVHQDSDTDSDSSEGEEETASSQHPPTQQLWSRGGHSKLVSALSFDPSGTRLVSGSYDFTLGLWDFTESQSNRGGPPRPFRSLEPCESHALFSASFSSTGDRILVCPAGAQLLVLDRDGRQLAQSPKGDQYLSDMAKTKGHVASLRAGAWHPRDKNVIASCAEDCTTRVWEVRGESLLQTQVMKARDSQGRKTVACALSYSAEGRHLAAGCRDGSVQVWAGNKAWNSRPNLWAKSAHKANCDVTSLLFANDSNFLFSRSADGSVKAWDLRKFREPLGVSSSPLPCSLGTSGLCLSPDERVLATAVSGTSKGEGAVVFIERDGMQEVERVQFSEVEGVGPILWQHKLNQLVCGCTDGALCFLFDVNRSQRGALFFGDEKSAQRSRGQESYVSGDLEGMIMTPHSLPLFREKRPWTLKRKREKEREEVSASKAPERPVGKQGRGGRLAESGGSLSSYIVKNLALKKVDREIEDPRAAILKFADSAVSSPFFVAPAYNKTQPHSVFRDENETGEVCPDENES